MARCRSCWYTTDTPDGICPVCGIALDKTKKSLTREERRVRSVARRIRGVAGLHGLCGILVLIAFVLTLVIFGPVLAKSHVLYPLAVLVTVASLLNCVLAVGLWRYRFWAYRLALALYALALIAGLIRAGVGADAESRWVGLISALFCSLCGYCVANTRARAIFTRQRRTARHALAAPGDPTPHR
jgi:hypothetical protein